MIIGASIDKPDRSPVAEESETNFDVDMCPNPDENKGPKLKKMLSLESGKEGIKQMKKVYIHSCNFMIPASLFYEVNDPLLQVCYKP